MMIIFGLLGALLIVSVLCICKAAGDADKQMEQELREIDWEELKKYMMITTEDEE